MTRKEELNEIIQKNPDLIDPAIAFLRSLLQGSDPLENSDQTNR